MNQIIEMFENLPKIAKVILLIFFGYLISPIYRILRYLETKNTLTLIVGIVCLVTGVGNVVLQVLDVITELTNNRITILA
jgi:NAD(P)H-flavin reductase